MDQDTFEKISELLLGKTENIGSLGCLVWLGGKCVGGYGRVKIRLPGNPSSKYVYTHRLAFMAYYKVLALPDGMHVSHRCHVKLCCNPTHLSLEPQMINNSRKNCAYNRKCCNNHSCYGVQYSDCIF